MNILVLMRMVPDVVEELEIAADGKALDLEAARMILSESDGHALEEAVLLKERYGGKVTAIALEAPEVDDALFTALAKGADRALKITGAEPGLTTLGAAEVFAGVVSGTAGLLPAELILTGIQAPDDLDGLIAPLLSNRLGLPSVGIVTRVDVNAAAQAATVVREYPGGMRGEFEVPLPAVLGIQAAEKPPRYVPVAKVRAVMKAQRIDTVDAPPAPASLAQVIAMAKPEAAGQAEMLEGSPEGMAAKVCDILAGRGLL
jgi:electron transfer flavoprotein beta subunit